MTPAVRKRRVIDPAMIMRGVQIEQREHKLPAKFTRKLVMDHLKENPRYYAGQKR